MTYVCVPLPEVLLQYDGGEVEDGVPLLQHKPAHPLCQRLQNEPWDYRIRLQVSMNMEGEGHLESVWSLAVDSRPQKELILPLLQS